MGWQSYFERGGCLTSYFQARTDGGPVTAFADVQIVLETCLEEHACCLLLQHNCTSNYTSRVDTSQYITFGC